MLLTEPQTLAYRLPDQAAATALRAVPRIIFKGLSFQ